MDGSRGVLLEYSIKYSKQIWRSIRTIYLSPLVKNPEKLLENNGENLEDRAYNSKEYSVRQNILKIEEKSEGYFDLKLNDNIIKQNIEIKKTKKNEANMANIYASLNNGENSIIYCNSPSSALKVCNELSTIYTIDISNNDEINSFVNFIENYIDKEYKLVKYLRKGIAFHYGNLPTFIRIGIEDLAKKGKIKTIVCTSTLLQGVNIPIQNIYIFNPRKGRERDNYLTNLEFWNLVGKAGRMGFDLSGNIILAQFGCWNDINIYDNTKKKLNISYATDLNENQIVEVEKAMVDNDYINKKNKELINNIESALIFDYISSDKSNVIMSKSAKIKNYIENSMEEYSEIQTLLKKLIGIKPESVKKVWDIFKLNDEKIEKFIIPHPYNEDFENKYKDALMLINEYIIPREIYTSEKSLFRAMYISSKWIKGKSMKEIIFHNFKEVRNEDTVTKRVSKEIDYLNSKIRYKLVKGMYAYQEILKEYLCSTNRNKIVEKIPNIPVFLEIGACDDVVVELISLGLMRELSFEINRKVSIDKENIIESLKKIEIQSLDLNNYLQNKLSEFIKRL